MCLTGCYTEINNYGGNNKNEVSPARELLPNSQFSVMNGLSAGLPSGLFSGSSEKSAASESSDNPEVIKEPSNGETL